MGKYIYDEKNGLWYELQGEYYLPCLRLPEEVEVHIGVWGQRHRRYLKEYRNAAYTRLLTSGKLNNYLANIDHQAEELFSQQVSQMAAAEGVTETLKASDQMKWVRRMNGIQNRAREIVNSELIYNCANPEYRPKTAVCTPSSVYSEIVRYRSNKQRI